ncbi:hypothetical protein PHYSODRAFT_333091 [Phytophthora sojae]|uniref:Neutral zinc metallopeptidase, Zn-binding site n=1 Tax=Phytophthora sojae (strain P6497) TaxID=1094619 RepID=G4ZNM7_PHYSP|nr:hypothetical protein PHYSODRAFT_333047 [Phytophthora sojae]XP_009528505.1 hypothetical protein PHYSODRAFT_333091 [Phytophthora sojae]EGZ14708.1 hypothetical protein PHYSODRAFT_333047 [Phytophthora sojae]EGZ14756.1 hypothetical protein PHYSODRAFT_333091 [Phytophthora sojae]|eukprot:XP_009528457.1 hypothetical protein PHYSODRAFT_333047 [Phytophthora sojae]
MSSSKPYISPKDLQWIWNKRKKAEVEPYDNWIMDHIVANKGTLNYCVRWDSKKTQPTIQATDLEWLDDSLGKIYIGDLVDKGSPQCHDNRYRSVDGSPGGWSVYSSCDGKPFDISLWATQNLGGGWGIYNFQQVDLDDMVAHLDTDELTIVSHDMGHGFGLPDFYEEPQPLNFKLCLMDALSTPTIKDTDGWMVRRVLGNKKPNYHL